MDPLVTGLLNFGGVGLLAAVLLWLHVNSLRSFREEMAEERKQCREMWERHIDLTNSRHETVMAKLNEIQHEIQHHA